MFTYDPAKAISNFRKHGVRLEDCDAALDDPAGITVEDWSEGEQRFVTIGKLDHGMIVVVTWTERRHVVRIISARKASPGEARQHGTRY
jgi:uncharacterized DUF497 family protein